MGCYEDIVFKNDSNVKSNNSVSKEELNDALNRAIDMYKFEMEMYWKRATYFLVFIGSTFIVCAKAVELKYFFYALCLSFFGFIISFIWYLANKSSKLWVKNWDIHVKELEKMVGINLFKHYCIHDTNAPSTNKWWSVIFKPGADYTFSISKLAHYSSYVIVWGWIISVLHLGYKWIAFNCLWDCLKTFSSWKPIIFSVGFIGLLCVMNRILQTGAMKLKNKSKEEKPTYSIYETD